MATRRADQSHAPTGHRLRAAQEGSEADEYYGIGITDDYFFCWPVDGIETTVLGPCVLSESVECLSDPVKASFCRHGPKTSLGYFVG